MATAEDSPVATASTATVCTSVDPLTTASLAHSMVSLILAADSLSVSPVLDVTLENSTSISAVASATIFSISAEAFSPPSSTRSATDFESLSNQELTVDLTYATAPTVTTPPAMISATSPVDRLGFFVSCFLEGFLLSSTTLLSSVVFLIACSVFLIYIVSFSKHIIFKKSNLPFRSRRLQ